LIGIAFVVSLFALGLAGCKGGRSEPVQAMDTKAAEFQANMKKFIEEARSLTRAMEKLPDRATYKKGTEAVKDAFSRISDPPAGNEALANCYVVARQISVDFEEGSTYLELIDDFRGLNSKEDADKTTKLFRELESQQKAHLNELEAALGEGRVAKIYDKDVIKVKK
jgi:hypothetical protein